MALTKAQQDVLRLARSVIRDATYNYPVDSRILAADPKEVCQLLSEILGEEYDFDSSEAEPISSPKPDGVWKVVDVSTRDLENTLNELAERGYQAYRITMTEPELFLVVAINPSKMAALQGQQLSNNLADMFKNNALAKMGL